MLTEKLHGKKYMVNQKKKSSKEFLSVSHFNLSNTFIRFWQDPKFMDMRIILYLQAIADSSARPPFFEALFGIGSKSTFNILYSADSDKTSIIEETRRNLVRHFAR